MAGVEVARAGSDKNALTRKKSLVVRLHNPPNVNSFASELS